jgi:hypothetical protein
MICTIKRTELPTKTISDFLVEGVHFGHILEDKVRDLNHDGDLDDAGETKVYGKTAINYGRYRLIVSFSNRFKKQMIQIINVRGSNIKFGDQSIDACGVRIHGGNDISDTLGCPLLGAKRIEDKKNPDYGNVYDCKAINETLLSLVKEADTKEEVYLDIVKA